MKEEDVEDSMMIHFDQMLNTPLVERDDMIEEDQDELRPP